MKYKYFANSIGGNIRIIGGKWKRRKIFVAPHVEVRPTTDVMRETLFNWLYDVVSDAVCLDCFAGSGALGLEALSRGARKVTFLEYNFICVLILLKTIRSFKACNDSEVVHINSLFWVNKLNEMYNIVFIDPPFKKNIIFKFVFLLEKYNCLQKKSWIYIETSAQHDTLNNMLFPNYWILYRKKITKNVKYYLYLRNL